jgi:hypothetical protein
MSEKINELMNQAMPTIDWKARHGVELNNGERMKWYAEWFENFAELIVRECADVAADHDALDIYEEIREHFGVEE